MSKYTIFFLGYGYKNIYMFVLTDFLHLNSRILYGISPKFEAIRDYSPNTTILDKEFGTKAKN